MTFDAELYRRKLEAEALGPLSVIELAESLCGPEAPEAVKRVVANTPDIDEGEGEMDFEHLRAQVFLCCRVEKINVPTAGRRAIVRALSVTGCGACETLSRACPGSEISTITHNDGANNNVPQQILTGPSKTLVSLIGRDAESYHEQRRDEKKQEGLPRREIDASAWNETAGYSEFDSQLRPSLDMLQKVAHLQEKHQRDLPYVDCLSAPFNIKRVVNGNEDDAKGPKDGGKKGNPPFSAYLAGLGMLLRSVSACGIFGNGDHVVAHAYLALVIQLAADYGQQVAMSYDERIRRRLGAYAPDRTTIRQLLAHRQIDVVNELLAEKVQERLRAPKNEASASDGGAKGRGKGGSQNNNQSGDKKRKFENTRNDGKKGNWNRVGGGKSFSGRFYNPQCAGGAVAAVHVSSHQVAPLRNDTPDDGLATPPGGPSASTVAAASSGNQEQQQQQLSIHAPTGAMPARAVADSSNSSNSNNSSKSSSSSNNCSSSYAEVRPATANGAIRYGTIAKASRVSKQSGLFMSIQPGLGMAQHVDEALELRFDEDEDGGVPRFTTEAARRSGSMTIAGNHEFREKALAYWEGKAESLPPKEGEIFPVDLWEKIDDEVDILMRGPGRKPLSFWKGLRKGFCVDGVFRFPELFSEHPGAQEAPSISREELLRRQPEVLREACSRAKRLPKEEVVHLWEATDKDVAAGFAEVLADYSEERPPPNAVFYPRFLDWQLKQDKEGWARKPRAVDDAASNHLNAATVMGSKIDCYTVDQFLATSRTFADAVEKSPEPGSELGGLGVDHESAYRWIWVTCQYARVVVLPSRCGKRISFIRYSRGLFGELALVPIYCSFGRLWSATTCRLLLIAVANYYDDFPAPVRLKDKTLLPHFLRLCKLLRSAVNESKVQFGRQIKYLGLMLQWQQSASAWRIDVSLSDPRKEKLIHDMNDYLSRNALSPGEAKKASGRLMWANQICCGRIGRGMAQPFYCRANSKNGGKVFKLNGKLRAAISWWVRLLSDREVGFQRSIPLTGRATSLPVVLYTDASEDGIGAVLFDAARKEVRWVQVDVDGAKERDPRTGKVEISRLETEAVVISHDAFSSYLKGRDVIHFVDNTVSQSNVTSGTARDERSARMVEQFWVIQARLSGFCWIERVASASNVSDLPSRRRHPIDAFPKGHPVRAWGWRQLRGVPRWGVAAPPPFWQ
eukprot:gene345-340_t